MCVYFTLDYTLHNLSFSFLFFSHSLSILGTPSLFFFAPSFPPCYLFSYYLFRIFGFAYLTKPASWSTIPTFFLAYIDTYIVLSPFSDFPHFLKRNKAATPPFLFLNSIIANFPSFHVYLFSSHIHLSRGLSFIPSLVISKWSLLQQQTLTRQYKLPC